MLYTIVDTKDSIVTSEILELNGDIHYDYNLYTREDLTEDQLMMRILDVHKHIKNVSGESVLEASLLSPKTFGTLFHTSNIFVKDESSVHTLSAELDTLSKSYLTHGMYHSITMADVSLLVVASYQYALVLVTDNTHDDRKGFFDLIPELSKCRYFTCIGEADWNTAHMAALFKLLCEKEAYVALSSFDEWKKFYTECVNVTQSPLQYVPRKYWSRDRITDHSTLYISGNVSSFEDSI